MRRTRATRPQPLRHLRDDRWLRLLAVLVMLFQVVLTADHLGVSAARAAVPPTETAGLGLLSMCHADGSTEPSAADLDDDGQPIDPGADRCALCSSPAVAGSVLAPSPPPTPVLPVPIGERLTLPVVEKIPVPSPLRYGTGRGPPATIRL